MNFLMKSWHTSPQISHEESSASHLLNDAKDVGFRLDEVPTLGQLKTLAV
jgi:hypothetical protein